MRLQPERYQGGRTRNAYVAVAVVPKQIGRVLLVLLLTAMEVVVVMVLALMGLVALEMAPDLLEAMLVRQIFNPLEAVVVQAV